MDLVFTESLDLFSPPRSDAAIDKLYFVEYLPTAAINQDSFINFKVNGSGGSYIDLSRTTIKITATITNRDGTPITDQSKISTANSSLHSAVSQLEIFLNNVNVAQGISNNYAYKAYLDYLLTKGSDFLENKATSCGWFADGVGY